jgi:predicted  nucleic acid-binding Zn-ribbon protein
MPQVFDPRNYEWREARAEVEQLLTPEELAAARAVEATVQGFEERGAKLETDIADTRKRGKELETKIGAPFEHEQRFQELCLRQSEIEEMLDLTKNQAPSQVDAVSGEDNEPKNSETQNVAETVRHRRRTGMSV